jgi:hypothetical protein
VWGVGHASLYDNQFGNEGMKVLAEALTKNGKYMKQLQYVLLHREEETTVCVCVCDGKRETDRQRPMSWVAPA